MADTKQTSELKEIRFQMQIAPSQMKAVEDWGWSHRIRTKAEAIRQLLDIGLASADLVEALKAAMAFIDSHVADPDITPEMAANWAALQKAEPHAALALAAGKEG